MKKHIAILAAVLSLNFGFCLQAASLKVGSAAPEIKVGKWIQGDPIDKLDSAGIYVVEFWATWCPPCRASIPHLTELAKKHQGKVRVIGVSVYERAPSDEARLKKVTDFVKEMGSKMTYTVAADNADKFMAKNWMEAADQNGIPASFIVKGGKIVWIGHPMQGLDKELDKLVKP